jgi:hypothetical protein
MPSAGCMAETCLSQAVLLFCLVWQLSLMLLLSQDMTCLLFIPQCS